MNIYSFTYIKDSDPVFITDYEDAMAIIKRKYPDVSLEYHYEYRPSDGRLHIHGKAARSRRMYINQIHPGKGWNVQWKPWYKGTWEEYIIKAPCEVDIINSEYALMDAYFQTTYDPEESVAETPITPKDPDEDCELPFWKTRRIV